MVATLHTQVASARAAGTMHAFRSMHTRARTRALPRTMAAWLVWWCLAALCTFSDDVHSISTATGTNRNTSHAGASPLPPLPPASLLHGELRHARANQVGIGARAPLLLCSLACVSHARQTRRLTRTPSIYRWCVLRVQWSCLTFDGGGAAES